MQTVRSKSFAPFILAIIALILVNQQQQFAHGWWLSSAASGDSYQNSNETQQKPNAQAVAKFDLDGVVGLIKFTSGASSDASGASVTKVEYDLTGLKGNNQKYHVHIRPVPSYDREAIRNNSTAIAKLCSDPATGGHLNPHHVSAKLAPKEAPFDKYEVGDLSGKHGPLKLVDQVKDQYVGSFQDDTLPMSGANNIIGRSIVIHKNDGARWVCATIEQV